MRRGLARLMNVGSETVIVVSVHGGLGCRGRRRGACDRRLAGAAGEDEGDNGEREETKRVEFLPGKALSNGCANAVLPGKR